MKTTLDINTTFALTCPLLLGEEEQQNPYPFLKDFFDFSSLEGYKEELSVWFRSAVSIGLRYGNANNLLFLHSQIIQLLNAGLLIASREPNPNCTNKSLAYITETITVETITTIRYGLREWVFAALNEDNDLSDAGHEYSFALYELLLKLVEACYLILTGKTTLNKETP